LTGSICVAAGVGTGVGEGVADWANKAWLPAKHAIIRLAPTMRRK
jgi:hypothetical protein